MTIEGQKPVDGVVALPGAKEIPQGLVEEVLLPLEVVELAIYAVRKRPHEGNPLTQRFCFEISLEGIRRDQDVFAVDFELVDQVANVRDDANPFCV